MADQWADQWVADHNAARSKYGLQGVTWDSQAAATAQAWADVSHFFSSSLDEPKHNFKIIHQNLFS
jgi:hypothetical protein